MKTPYDVIIAGTGVGGLYTALNLPDDLNILLITKRELILCNSALAQGGVAAVYKPVDDNIQLHTNDTLIAGGFKNNPDSVNLLVTRAAGEIEKILSLGVEFDRDANGNLNRTLEGGHSRRRIFHHKDSTGLEVTSKLQAAVKRKNNITILENTQLCRLKKIDGGFAADLLRNGTHETFRSRFFVMATGGIGRVYEYTTNSAIATGDGIAIAYEAGAQIKNLSYIQFHPTAFADHETRECFLISESVRGEGAYLLNCNGERFMQDYDDRLELAPRDVVSHAIITESKKTESNTFYLDITHKDPDFIRSRFPMIYKKLMEHGIDMTKDRIPIYPCHHYLMGGINVNTSGETAVKGLYAVGECSHTGVHGNNRLASNSLLEALVFGHQAADDIAANIENARSADIEEFEFEQPDTTEHVPRGIRTEVRHIMQQSYFVIPNIPEAVKGFERISELKHMLENGSYVIDEDFVEASSITICAYLILKEVI
ncbi:MAG: L-aspartate oxidase [Oscillospiraceae bacterium]|nr:L-aspartate oxidase [Oscillospiraceae bacterium]